MGYDVDEFMGIYHAHKNMVFKIAQHYVKNLDDAEEVMQDVFEELFKAEIPVQKEKIRSYLIKASKNTSIDVLRKKKHFCVDGFDGEQQWKELMTDSVEVTYMEAFVRREFEELCNCIMSELYCHNREWHQVIHMMYYLEMSGDEIAKKMGIDTEILYSRTYRAKKWIQKKYKERYCKLRRCDI